MHETLEKIAKTIIGMDYNYFRSFWGESGENFEWRLTRVDDTPYVGTSDLDRNRMNLVVEQGIIKEVTFG